MPKDEFDFEDPFELNGMAFLTHEDTTDAMAETFTEEFLRMGYNHKQILTLFRSRHYLGPNMALEKRGEPFIRDLIAEVFARWGRPVAWGEVEAQASAGVIDGPPLVASSVTVEMEATATDPMGAPIPKLNL
jgi:hypothetical protein